MTHRVSIKYLLVGIVLILSLLLGSSCVYIEPPTSQPQPQPISPPAAAAPANPNWTLPPPSGENAPLPDFVSVVAKVKPSVVAITTEVVTSDIFNRPSTQKGAGSGWIIDKGGHIVTNNHVIEGAKSITVTMADGSVLPAGVVGSDPLNDLAVLKVTTDDTLPPVPIGDAAKLRVGEWVLAIGNALGEGISAKQGTISRLDVTVPVSQGQTLYDLIETSAAINPGNSGGPLVNMSGEVIGITSVKLSAVEVEGVGYAISTATASPIITELIQKGYVVRPWLGVVLGTVNQWLALRYDLSVDTGAFITEVAPNSPAAKAGLKAGDVIVEVNGKKLTSAQDMIKAIHSSKRGDKIEIAFWRGDKQDTATAILAESPPPP
ncbi:S1C family serine protease [Chloroflexota bacterium]